MKLPLKVIGPRGCLLYLSPSICADHTHHDDEEDDMYMCPCPPEDRTSRSLSPVPCPMSPVPCSPPAGVLSSGGHILQLSFTILLLRTTTFIFQPYDLHSPTLSPSSLPLPTLRLRSSSSFDRSMAMSRPSPRVRGGCSFISISSPPIYLTCNSGGINNP